MATHPKREIAELKKEEVSPADLPPTSSEREGDEKESVGELVQLVVFRLGKGEFCVDIGEVREIVEKPEITPIPNTPDFISGMINVRGKIIVIVDLGAVFQLAHQAGEQHILIAELLESSLGILIDEVTEVIRVPKKDIKEAPAVIAKKFADQYLKGVALVKNRMLIYIDLTSILSEKKTAGIKRISQSLQARKKRIGKK